MIILACDHGGFELKEYLKQYFAKHKIEYIDCGAYTLEPMDEYPMFAKKAVKEVLKDENNRGIFICGSGVGISMVANRYKGIRCVLAYNAQIAHMARWHQDANVLALGANYTSKPMALKIIKEFFNTGFEGGRHIKRLEQF